MAHPPLVRDTASVTQIITEILGEEIGGAFFQAFRGRILYVPKRFFLDHPIVQAIGIESAQRLQAEFGGQQLVISVQSATERATRNKKIWADRETMSLQSLAQKYELSVRHICKILKDMKADNENIRHKCTT